MKVWIRAIFLVVLVLVQTSGPAFAGRFRVTKVYDGDTLKAETPDLVIYVMLVGIDAPEIAQRSGQPDQPSGGLDALRSIGQMSETAARLRRTSLRLTAI